MRRRQAKSFKVLESVLVIIDGRRVTGYRIPGGRKRRDAIDVAGLALAGCPQGNQADDLAAKDANFQEIGGAVMLEQQVPPMLMGDGGCQMLLMSLI